MSDEMPVWAALTSGDGTDVAVNAVGAHLLIMSEMHIE